jgi:hypothetical protein
MPAVKNNKYAAKKEEERASAHLHIRVKKGDRDTWVRSALEEGEKLSPWVIHHLNRVSRK